MRVSEAIYDDYEQHSVTNCWKCGGSGYLPEYAHIQGGVCFSCSGESGGRMYRHSFGLTDTKTFTEQTQRRWYAIVSIEGEQRILVDMFTESRPSAAFNIAKTRMADYYNNHRHEVDDFEVIEGKRLESKKSLKLRLELT